MRVLDQFPSVKAVYFVHFSLSLNEVVILCTVRFLTLPAWLGHWPQETVAAGRMLPHWHPAPLFNVLCLQNAGRLRISLKRGRPVLLLAAGWPFLLPPSAWRGLSKDKSKRSWTTACHRPQCWDSDSAGRQERSSWRFRGVLTATWHLGCKSPPRPWLFASRPEATLAVGLPLTAPFLPKLVPGSLPCGF